jgi:hypothetical protein
LGGMMMRIEEEAKLLLLLLSHCAYHKLPTRAAEVVGADGLKRWQKAAVQSLECPGNAGRRASELYATRPAPILLPRIPPRCITPSTLDAYFHNHTPDRMALLTTSAPVNYDEQEGLCARAKYPKLQLTANSGLC